MNLTMLCVRGGVSAFWTPMVIVVFLSERIEIYYVVVGFMNGFRLFDPLVLKVVFVSHLECNGNLMCKRKETCM